MADLSKIETSNVLVPESNINEKALKKVEKFLPELIEKSNSFDRKNSQSTLSLMTLTMMCGHSPYRMLRQVLAEVEKKRMALSEAQTAHAKKIKTLEFLENKTDSVQKAKYREVGTSLHILESKINGSIKDIAVLIEAYNNIKEANNIDDWDEEAFEKEEKKHHVRRSFELMYRNVLEVNRAKTSTIEYCQQFGIHPQVCLTETSGYVAHTQKLISEGEILHSNHLEEFLDEMANKYYKNADKTAERLFGKADFAVSDYMYKTVTK